jgi:hypothetical protein
VEIIWFGMSGIEVFSPEWQQTHARVEFLEVSLCSFISHLCVIQVHVVGGGCRNHMILGAFRFEEVGLVHLGS